MSQNTSNKISKSEQGKTVFSQEKLRDLVFKKIKETFIPSSVYRIQFNRDFTFKQAERIVPYLKELGIEAVYCSPYFQASPGSMHGYNVTDPNRINSEIGSSEDFEKFCQALLQNGLGHIVDVVPNHMGVVGNNNSWWLDVLENGPSSLYAKYFDIDWKPVKQELWGKVLLPILGNFYGSVLENQEIQIVFQKGEFNVFYHEHRFPVDPKTYPVILENDIAGLEDDLGKENQDYLEFLSIITAFKNLPAAAECTPEKVIERNREKEIAKHRLDALCERSEQIQTFIKNRVIFFNGNKSDPKSFDPIDRFLDLQSYRLAFWSVASQEINYRRFFDINELAAIRIEDEKVFRHYHELIFKLIKEQKVSGLRIDHPDGLYDPPVYFQRLQREYLLQMAIKEWEGSLPSGGAKIEDIDMELVREILGRLLEKEFPSSLALYVVAEKILDRKEPLPENWDINGTVGYDYLNSLNGLFVDPCSEKVFEQLYERYIGHPIDFDELVYNKKKFFGLVPMASEINALGHRLNSISETNRNFRDFTRNDLTVAIRETIAGFPVYRTYVSVDSASISDRDEKYIRAAIKKARAKTPALNPAVYDFLQEALLLRLKTEPQSQEAKSYRDFLLRFQQLTGPIMAKGVEDTSFYVYNRLVSLNEVGGDPFYFGYTVDAFHRQNIERNRRWPSGMLASSTHDTKRSEDVRMRINVLSEIPDEWESRINEWAQMNQRFKTAICGVFEPRRNTEYFIYQTLIGAWPDEPMQEPVLTAFYERIWQYVLKSVREAKIYTSWFKPEIEYEDAVNRFIKGIIFSGSANDFLASFLPFQEKISFWGKLNSLSATLIKIASPGVVDIYQGNEIFCYNLVDPDNRRPVDFDFRMSLLGQMKSDREQNNLGNPCNRGILPENISSLKLFYTWGGLQFRRQYKELFVGGEYLPVEIRGNRDKNIVSFIRKYGDKIALLVAGRFFSQWPLGNVSDLDQDFWGNTELVWPKDLALPEKLKDVVTGEIIDISKYKQIPVIGIADLLQKSCGCLFTNI